MNVKTTLDLNELRRTLRKNERKQIPFAIALATTMTGNDTVDELRRELPRRFTIRNNWTAKGIRATRATKSKPYSHVYTRDHYMRLHEEGGRKLSTSSDGTVPIPRKILKSKAQRMTRAKSGRAIPKLLKQKKTYKAPIGNRGNMGILRRKGRGGQGPPDLLWILEKNPVRIKPTWNFEDTAVRVMRKRFDHNFRKAFDKAIATARD